MGFNNSVIDNSLFASCTSSSSNSSEGILWKYLFTCFGGGICFQSMAMFILVYTLIAEASTIVYGPLHLIFIFALCESLAIYFFKAFLPTSEGLLKVHML